MSWPKSHHFFGKTDSEFWSNFVRKDPRAQVLTGYVVSYQCVTQSNVSSANEMILYCSALRYFRNMWPMDISHIWLKCDPRRGLQ